MSTPYIDKLVLGFLADILYVQGVINYDQLQGIYDIKTASDMEAFMENLLGGRFNAYRTGEHYTRLCDAE